VELESFRSYADKSPDGWGIGYFDEGGPHIHKKCGPASNSNEYSAAAETSEGRMIIAHLRDASDKNTVSDRNTHPFTLSFLGRPWLFAHNGTMSVEYKSSGEKVDSDIDSARLLEFLSDQISGWYSREGLRSLFGSVKKATENSYREFRGTANFVLTDGEFCFVNKDGMHHNQIYVKRLNDSIRFCTKQLEKEWLGMWKPSGFRGRLILAARGELLCSQRIGV
jgi:glutamine amidotransferase